MLLVTIVEREPSHTWFYSSDAARSGAGSEIRVTAADHPREGDYGFAPVCLSLFLLA